MQEFPTSIVFTIIALAIVLALAWIILRFLASLGKRTQGNQSIKLVGSYPLNSRSRVMILNYRGHDYMLGVSPEQVSLLDKHPATGTANEQSTLVQDS